MASAAVVWSYGCVAGLGEEREDMAVLVGCGGETVDEENGASRLRLVFR